MAERYFGSFTMGILTNNEYRGLEKYLIYSIVGVWQSVYFCKFKKLKQ